MARRAVDRGKCGATCKRDRRRSGGAVPAHAFFTPLWVGALKAPAQIWLVVIWKLNVGLGINPLGRKTDHELRSEDDRGLVHLFPGEQIDQHLPGSAGHRERGVDDGGQRW